MSHISRRTFLGTAGLTAAGVATGPWVLRAHAQAQTIKIGILYDHTGPFSAAGSLNCWRGAKMIIDYLNEKGGIPLHAMNVISYGENEPVSDNKSKTGRAENRRVVIRVLE